MAAVAVKRKLIVDKSPTHRLLHSPLSPITLVRRRGVPSDLESSEGSSTSLRSDAAYTATLKEDVQAVARAVNRIALKYPEAICQLMVVGHTIWNEAELKAFPEVCMEEIEARTITSTCPNRQGYINLEVKMLQKVQKNTHRGSASAGRDLTEHALQEPSEQTPRHGKRSLTRGTTSGGSSKRSRGSSASDALNRLADLRVQSNDSRTRTEEIKQAKSAKACMELLKADGYTSRDHIYHMVLRVFRDGFLREFFLDDCHTSEGRFQSFFVHITAFCVDGFFGAAGDAVLGAIPINAVGDDAATGDGEGDGVGDDDDDDGDGEAYGDGDDEGGDGAGDGHDDYGDDGNGGAADITSGPSTGNYSDEEDIIIDMLVADLEAHEQGRAARQAPKQHPLYNGYPNFPQAPPLRDWYDAPNSAAGMRAVCDAIADEVYNN
ncbi:hypothetical protein OsI_32944 [Oryza sativa Indica Group]|uniref:Uncharacterized protein n=1 Tax=Oryza sativa subsp. indica TaxID=39946 RepID=B8BG09_ORYSI|nr:hypothetical protein OsI_32944 [Oryza sativa Indica Group]